MVGDLWRKMNDGGFSPALGAMIRKFNGGLFAPGADGGVDPLPVDEDMLNLLVLASRRDWADVEPAVFGTLLENALDAHQRGQLGAHFTPRSFVERLVLPTVMEPLRADWDGVKAAASAAQTWATAQPPLQSSESSTQNSARFAFSTQRVGPGTSCM